MGHVEVNGNARYSLIEAFGREIDIAVGINAQPTSGVAQSLTSTDRPFTEIVTVSARESENGNAAINRGSRKNVGIS
jgi:hypothetical protein